MTSTDAQKLTGDNLSSIIIYGAGIAADGQPIPLTLKRQIPALDVVETWMKPCSCRQLPCECVIGALRPGGAPVRVSVSQRPALTTEVQLEFALNKLIGRGEFGLVYSTELSSLSLTTNAMAPFVVKFAARKRSKNLFREAWFYDELQSLQGSTIPRCYGYFEAELPEGCTFTPWKTMIKENYEELEDTEFEPRGRFNPAYRSTIARFETAAYVTVLLLEPLDHPFLRPNMPNSQLDDAIDQVRVAYSDINHFGVQHGDVRPTNILAVTKSSAVEPSPISHKTYPFRIIDFGWSRKCNYSNLMIRTEHEANLDPIRECIWWSDKEDEESLVVKPCFRRGG